MTVQYVNHDLRSYDGGTVYMPPYIGGEKGWGNLAIPDVHLATVDQRYPRGTMFRKGEYSWVHSKLKTTTRTGTQWGATGYGGYSQGLGLFSVAKPTTLTVVTGSAEKGEYTITVDSQDVNEFAGGLLSIFEAGLPLAILRIISNTATVFTLDGPLPTTYTASATAHAVPSPYKDVVMAGINANADAVFDYCPGIFISTVDESGNVPAANDFVWLQTAGLCIMWASGTYEGDLGGEREVIVQGGGGAQVLVASETGHTAFQRIGQLYPSLGTTTVGDNPSTGGSTSADATMMTNIIMLTIRQ